MTPCDALRRMMVEADVEQACANAIRDAEGWSLSDDQAIDRMRQCLSHKADRRFCADWQPIVERIVARAGGEDLVTGLLDAARRDGEHDRELADEERRLERPGPIRVEPRRHRERGCA